MITDFRMGNMFSSTAPSLPSLECMVGTFKRVSCTGMEELLMVQTGFADKRTESAGSNDTPCYLTVEMEEATHMWTMKYKRSNMSQTIMFKMPGHAKFPVDVIKVMNTPERSTPQHKMEVVRNATGSSMVFSDKKMKKGTIRMERKFSEDWRTVTQVVTVRGEEVSCIEVFRRMEEEIV